MARTTDTLMLRAFATYFRAGPAAPSHPNIRPVSNSYLLACAEHLEEAAAELDALRLQLAALHRDHAASAQDAARYRFLREHRRGVHCVPGHGLITYEVRQLFQTGGEFGNDIITACDLSIDAAALAQPDAARAEEVCPHCKGSKLITITNYDGNGSDADDQPCSHCEG
jgi:hypothetical protein